MPVFIGDYLADTMHLNTEQHGAYLLLLFHLWRKESLRDDDAVLGKICGLSEKAWRTQRGVLAEFFQVADGFWTHKRVEKERTRVAAVQRSKASKAKLAANTRWGKTNASGNAQALLEYADIESQSKSDSQVREKNFPPQAEEAAQVCRSSVPHRSQDTSLDKVVDPRHGLFRGLLAEYWRQKNHAAPEMPWQARDGKALHDFLKACPLLDERQFRTLLSNRAKSAVAHGDRVYLWVGNLTRFQEEITVYNKPVSAGGSYASRAEINRNSVFDSVGQATEMARRYFTGPGEPGAEPAAFDDPGMPADDGAGSGGCSFTLPGDGDYGLAAGDSADGEAGADGPLPYGATAAGAGGVNANGRQEVKAC